MNRRTALAAATAAVALTACSPAQTRAWLDWHGQDPAAAEAYTHTAAGQALIHHDADRDGYVDRAPTPTPSTGSPTPGDCASYAPLFRAYGLPVATFTHIAWRESGCNHRSFVMNATDSGGGLLGINLKGSLAATWYRWCGATLGNITNATVNVRCAAAAYRRMGLAPWS